MHCVSAKKPLPKGGGFLFQAVLLSILLKKYAEMVLKYELSTDELSENILDSIKKVFQKKRITITVAEAEMDETEYLLSTEANRNALAESMAQIERGEVVKFTMDEINQYAHEE